MFILQQSVAKVGVWVETYSMQSIRKIPLLRSESTTKLHEKTPKTDQFWNTERCFFFAITEIGDDQNKRAASAISPFGGLEFVVQQRLFLSEF